MLGRMNELFEGDELFEGIDHVGYAVPDLAEAVRFHTEVLGWPCHRKD